MESFLKKIKKKLTGELFPENRKLLDIYGGDHLCYILGTSGTINELDLKKLESDAVKITVGNFHEHPDIEKINPSIHIFAASHAPITKEILTKWWQRCEEKLPKSIPILVEYTDRDVAQKVFKNREVFLYSYGGKKPADFTSKVISPVSVSLVAVQLALFLRVKNTYLLGIEHEWRYRKPYGHFYSHDKPSLELYLKEDGIASYAAKPKHKKNLKGALYSYFKLYQQHEVLKKHANSIGINVYNGDPNSYFDVYEQKPLAHL